MQQYFADEYNNADIKADCYKDVKNGGDIAKKQKFTDKEHSQSYELQYALQNADKRCPERMYKALVVAYSKGLIPGSDSRWDEGATKEDFLSILTNAYISMPTQLSADKGENASNQIAGTNTTTETDAAENPQNDTSITIEDFEALVWDKYNGQPSPEAFAEGRELFMKKWAGSLADPESMTEEERNEYQSDRAFIYN